MTKEAASIQAWVGLDSGKTFWGVVGCTSRKEFMLFSNGVSMSERMCGVAYKLNVQLVFAANVHQKLPPDAQKISTQLPSIQFKGKKPQVGRLCILVCVIPLFAWT